MEQFYRELKYPVWQFAKDINIDVPLTEAIKYTLRYGDKLLEEDKVKAKEYLNTLRSFEEYYPCNWYKKDNLGAIHSFIEQLNETDKERVKTIIEGRFKDAIESLDPSIYDSDDSNKEYLTHCSTC